MTDARLAGELAGILEPMVEPTQQQRIGIEQGFGAEVLLPHQLSPRDMHPGTGDQVLVFRLRGHGHKAGDAARQVSVEPAGDVQRGQRDPRQRFAYIQGGPVRPRRIVSKPVAHVGGQALMLELRMQPIGCDQGLAAQIGPGFLQAITRASQFAPASIGFQHLQAPAEA